MSLQYLIAAESGNCEEQLPSTDCQPIVAPCWPTVSGQSADKRPTVGQLLAICRPSDFGLTVGDMSVSCQWLTFTFFLSFL